MLEVRGLSKTYVRKQWWRKASETVALRDVSFTIPTGSMKVLLDAWRRSPHRRW